MRTTRRLQLTLFHKAPEERHPPVDTRVTLHFQVLSRTAARTVHPRAARRDGRAWGRSAYDALHGDQGTPLHVLHLICATSSIQPEYEEGWPSTDERAYRHTNMV